MSTATKNRPRWYTNLKQIRQKQNHAWTRAELRRVYYLRIQGKGVDDIIKKMNLDVKRTQVYNMVRILRKNHLNRCFQCGDALTGKELESQRTRHFKRCDGCRASNEAQKKSVRNRYLTKHLCGCCGERKVIPGKTYCIHCLSYTNRQRIATGMCGSCGRNPINKKRSIALCNVCLDRNVKVSRKYRKEQTES
jgi:hypothetical protein